MFAFVFAPVGAVLGHLALSQIKVGRQQGRDRALVGLTLSYVFILFAVVALVLWAITARGDQSPSPAHPSPPPQHRCRRQPRTCKRPLSHLRHPSAGQ